MLNRLYIVIGVLAILVLGAGFVVPKFIDWDGYRERLEAIAEQSLGTDVIIGGNIDFTLLPQPKIRFGKTVIGPAFSPLMEIESIVAEFSLMDFLRDRFVVTNLVLKSPILSLSIDDEGNVENPLQLLEQMDTNKISISEAQIVAGTIRLRDKRSNQNWSFDQFEGELSIADIRGPFGLKGTGLVGGRPHTLRLSMTAINDANLAQASFFWRPSSGDYSLAGEGLLNLGASANFIGSMTLKSAPFWEAEEDEVSGDFVFSSEIDLSTQQLLFSSFELQPDENQAGSRLSGAAVIHLGENQNFDIVLSGGVVAFSPKDIRQEVSAQSYDLVEFLANIPPPVSLPMPGRLGIDIAELNVQNFALRDVRLDATLSQSGWDIENFFATLTGDSKLHLTGSATNQNGQFGFQGLASIQTPRLGMLARLWRDVNTNSPLQNTQGSIEAGVELSNGTVNLSQGKLVIGEQAHEFSGGFYLKDERMANITLGLADVNNKEGELLLELLPGLDSSNMFGKSFPKGRVLLSAEKATLFGLAGTSMALDLAWSDQGIAIERISAFDFGGAQFSLSAQLLDEDGGRNFLGGGRFTLSEAAKNGFVPWAEKFFPGDEFIGEMVLNSLPIDLNIDLGPQDESGLQVFSAEGKAGAALFDLLIEFDQGIEKLRDAPIHLVGNISSDNADLLSSQLGLGTHSFIGQDQAVELSISANGSLSGKLETQIVASTDEESFGYSGNLLLTDLKEIEGQGKVDFNLQDLSAVQELMGFEGFHLPAYSGSVDLSFGNNGIWVFDNLMMNGATGGPIISGQFTATRIGETRKILGQLTIPAMELSDVLSTISGPASLIGDEIPWPVGPVDLGVRRRSASGRVQIRSAQILHQQSAILEDFEADLVWNETKISLENIEGKVGNGVVLASVSICCTGIDSQKQLSGRFTLSKVESESVFTSAISQNIVGTLDAGANFETSGASIKDMVQSLSGEGSFSLNGAALHHLDPQTFSSLIANPDISDLDADALAVLVGIALDQGDFEAESISGLFQVAAGKVRTQNIAAVDEGARIIGDLRVDLNNLGLDGNWTLTPSNLINSDGLLTENTAQITAIISGTLDAPSRVLELQSMVDAIELRKLEIELDQLEALRAEQAARSAEIALNRAKLMEQDTERRAAEAAALLAQEEERRQAQAAADAALQTNGSEIPLVFEGESQDPLLQQSPVFNIDPVPFGPQPTDLLAQ